jgi:hypothetical protein
MGKDWGTPGSEGPTGPRGGVLAIWQAKQGGVQGSRGDLGSSQVSATPPVLVR